MFEFSRVGSPSATLILTTLPGYGAPIVASIFMAMTTTTPLALFHPIALRHHDPHHHGRHGRGDGLWAFLRPPLPVYIPSQVIGVPDERSGEIPKAFVTLRPGRTATEAELILHCREHLADFKCPTKIEFGALPKTPTGTASELGI